MFYITIDEINISMPQNKDILIEPHPTLRKQADKVKKEDISSFSIQNLIKKMAYTLVGSENGVGLAAPQIGVSLRLFIVFKKAVTLEDRVGDKKQPSNDPLEEIDAYINPEIINRSRNKIIFDEGCLSVPNMYGKIKRSEKVKIRALNEKGKTIERGASGLLAEIFQHEVDHLNGVLFIDSAKDLQEYKPKSE